VHLLFPSNASLCVLFIDNTIKSYVDYVLHTAPVGVLVLCHVLVFDFLVLFSSRGYFWISGSSFDGQLTIHDSKQPTYQ